MSAAMKIIRFMPAHIKSALEKYLVNNHDVREIRFRAQCPLEVVGIESNFIKKDGTITYSSTNALWVKAEDCKAFFRNITGCSMYALEQQLAQLYLTVEGGVRIGMAGGVTVEEGKIKLIRDCTFFNIRIPYEVRNCARGVMRYLLNGDRVHNTLLISPPMAGKTTLLRDIARQLSDGLQTRPMEICIVDERGELAASVNGVPQFDVGMRTDVLDNCPKQEGIIMAVRVMSPNVIITDEIGSATDTTALLEAAASGVNVIASAHGRCVADVFDRQALSKLQETKFFERFVVLSRRSGPGTIEGVYDKSGIQIAGNLRREGA